MSALGPGAVAPDGSIDPSKLDPAAQKAFQYAVDFYEVDHRLNPSERAVLASTYSTISYTTLGLGWGTFFAVTSVPFYRQKLKTGSTKGTNVGVAMLFGLGAMMFASPFAANSSYNWQLEKLRQENQRCYEVAKYLKPAEATKWSMYYQLTKDHPEHIMKDPRSKEAADIRKKTIYSGRDPMGLYSGPRAEMRKKPQDPVPPPAAGPGQQDTAENTVTDDPFQEQPQEENEWSSAWDRVRDTKGALRGTQRQTPQPERRQREDEELYADGTSQAEFDRLLEMERKGEEIKEKW